MPWLTYLILILFWSPRPVLFRIIKHLFICIVQKIVILFLLINLSIYLFIYFSVNNCLFLNKLFNKKETRFLYSSLNNVNKQDKKCVLSSFYIKKRWLKMNRQAKIFQFCIPWKMLKCQLFFKQSLNNGFNNLRKKSLKKVLINHKTSA